MRAHPHRLWILAGTLLVAVLVAVTGLLLVPGQHADADELVEQTDIARSQAVKLRAKTTELAEDQARIGELRAQDETLTAALPATSGVPSFLRQLEATGTAVGVDVNGLTVGTPEADKAVPGIWALPIQLTANGTAEQLGVFLDKLQGSSATRAVLIETVNLAEAGGGTSTDGTVPAGDDRPMSLDLNIKAFVAQPAGAAAPVVTTD